MVEIRDRIEQSIIDKVLPYIESCGFIDDALPRAKVLAHQILSIPELSIEKQIEQEDATIDWAFDYEVIAKCQYGVQTVYAYGGIDVVDCDKPATHKVWWAEDASDAMFVCTEHLESIRHSYLGMGNRVEQSDRLGGEVDE